MKRKLLLVFSVLTLVTSLILITTGIASGDAGSQTWYLHSAAHPDVIWKALMLKDDIQTDEDKKWIESEDYMIWLSSNAAVNNVTFPDGQWEVNFRTDDDWTSYLTVLVGEFDTEISEFIPFSTVLVSKTYDDTIVNVKLNTTASNTVYADNYLALKIQNDNSVMNYVYSGPNSWLKSPPSDPGYPLPEIATGILLAVGIGGLGSYIAVRRKRTGAIDQ